MKIAFILVEPRLAEHVGAAARALKTMGFSDLRLVGRARQQEEAARTLAHGSGDILAASRSFADLADALADVDLVIGTTAKSRHQRRIHLSPEELTHSLSQRSRTVQRVGIVFGREQYGLSNEEIARCDLLSQIPQSSPQPSLNLAQSVMVYSYVLSGLETAAAQPTADAAQYAALKSKLGLLLNSAGIVRGEKSWNWAMERLAQGGDKDIRFLHFICAKIAARMPKPSLAADAVLQPDQERSKL